MIEQAGFAILTETTSPRDYHRQLIFGPNIYPKTYLDKQFSNIILNNLSLFPEKNINLTDFKQEKPDLENPKIVQITFQRLNLEEFCELSQLKFNPDEFYNLIIVRCLNDIPPGQKNLFGPIVKNKPSFYPLPCAEINDTDLVVFPKIHDNFFYITNEIIRQSGGAPVELLNRFNLTKIC